MQDGGSEGRVVGGLLGRRLLLCVFRPVTDIAWASEGLRVATKKKSQQFPRNIT